MARRSPSTSVPPGPLLEFIAHLSAADAAEVCRVSPRTVARWRTGASRSVPISAADAAAIALGAHLSQLYPELYFGAAA